MLASKVNCALWQLLPRQYTSPGVQEREIKREQWLVYIYVICHDISTTNIYHLGSSFIYMGSMFRECIFSSQLNSLKKTTKPVALGNFGSLEITAGGDYLRTFQQIPWTLRQQFIKKFLSFGGLGMPGICSRSTLGFSYILTTVKRLLVV